MSFDRVKAAGWAAFEILTSLQVNKLDTNISLATDGRMVPDYIGAINFLPVFGSDCRQGSYDPVTDRWVYVGGPDGTPVSFYSLDNYRFVSGGAVASTGTWGVRDMATNPSGVTVAVGKVTTSTSKVRRTADGGTTWTAPTAGAADSNALVTVCWHAPSSLFVAGGDSGLIVTSPDGVTWTTRAAPGSWGTFNIGCIATDSTGSLIATRADTGAGVTDYMRTTDPTNWSSAYANFASSRTQGVVWSVASSQWVTIGSPCQRSSSGTSWSSAGTSPVLTGGTIAINRNLIIAASGDAYITTDYGATFYRIYDGTTNSFTRFKFGRGQFVGFHAGSNSRGSLRAGLT